MQHDLTRKNQQGLSRVPDFADSVQKKSSVCRMWLIYAIGLGLWGFNATFNNISIIQCQSVLLVEKTWVPGENHQPTASHWQYLSHKVVSSYEPDSNSQL